jgi:hypothetical protein
MIPAGEASPADADGQMAVQFERIIRRVKLSMNYRGSYSTQDILGSLVARWVHSGEWQRLKSVPPEQRQIGPSVRRFLLDRLDTMRVRGLRIDIEDLELPDDEALVEQVELAELRQWLEARVEELERGEPDSRIRITLADPVRMGTALRLLLAGQTQRRIAEALGISLGLANKRIVEGTRYLIVLRSIEQGIAL